MCQTKNAFEERLSPSVRCYPHLNNYCTPPLLIVPHLANGTKAKWWQSHRVSYTLNITASTVCFCVWMWGYSQKDNFVSNLITLMGWTCGFRLYLLSRRTISSWTTQFCKQWTLITPNTYLCSPQPSLCVVSVCAGVCSANWKKESMCLSVYKTCACTRWDVCTRLSTKSYVGWWFGFLQVLNVTDRTRTWYMTFRYCWESGQGSGVVSFGSNHGDDLPVTAIYGWTGSDHQLGDKWLGTAQLCIRPGANVVEWTCHAGRCQSGLSRGCVALCVCVFKAWKQRTLALCAARSHQVKRLDFLFCYCSWWRGVWCFTNSTPTDFE